MTTSDFGALNIQVDQACIRNRWYLSTHLINTQGMSDLATPFLALFDDDPLAFWCFAQLMQTARFNFRHDETGIRGQLATLMGLLQVVDPVLSHRLRQIGAGEGLFAYRYVSLHKSLLRALLCIVQYLSMCEYLSMCDYLCMSNMRAYCLSCTPLSMLVAMLRRETTVAQSMSLWEVVWAQGLLQEPATAKGASTEPPFFMFVVAAVIRSHRRAVLDEARDVDDVLRLFANVRVDVWSTLRMARVLQRAYRTKQAEA